MRKVKEKLIILIAGLLLCSLAFSLSLFAYEVDYKGDKATIIDKSYLVEDVRFEVPYILSTYHISKSREGNLLFFKKIKNKFSFVLYDQEGNLVFGNPLDIDTFEEVESLKDKQINLIVYRYNLIDLGKYNIDKAIVFEDDSFFYLPITITGDTFSIKIIRFSKDTGAVDQDYENIIFEADIEASYSCLAIYDENKDPLIILSSRKLVEDKQVRELYSIDKNANVTLIYEDEDFACESSFMHTAFIKDGKLYLLEGVTYAENDQGERITQAYIYKFGEETKRLSLTSFVLEGQTIDEGQYYCANMFESKEGIGLIFNYNDMNTNEYYIALAILDFDDFSFSYQNHVKESNAHDLVEFYNYVDLILIDGSLSYIQETRLPAEDIIFQGDLLEIAVIGMGQTLELRTNPLTRAEVKYGSANGAYMYLFDRIPEYDKYLEELTDDVLVDFVSLTSGEIIKINGLYDLSCAEGEEVDLLQGIELFDLRGYSLSMESQYEGNKFEAALAGQYTLIIKITDSQNRSFQIERSLLVQAKEEEIPKTYDSYYLLYFLLSVAVLTLSISLKRVKL